MAVGLGVLFLSACVGDGGSGTTGGTGGVAGSSTGAGGATGAAGATGGTGATGTAGAAGTAGGAGSAGSAGMAGTGGRGGTTGAAGSAGTTGSGARGGATGAAGSAGTTGSGARGGTTGAAGTTGTAGRCGAPACFTTFQAASVVIGQANLTLPTAASPGPVPPATMTASASTLYSPAGNPFFDGTTLFIADTFNNRVLGFTGIPASSPGTASLVLGQTSVTSGTTAGTGAQRLNHPGTVFAAGGKLFVADTGNNRVLIYNTPVGNNASAVVAVGQADLSGTATGCTATTLNRPQSLYVTGGKLIVADTMNNRVMIWNSIPTANPTPAANLILGQASATNCNARATAANNLSWPADVWSDGTRLAVADLNNNRVLIWSTFPTSNVSASFVLGQPNFTGNTADMMRSTMGSPSALDSDGTSLYVLETANHRILVWQQFPTAATALLPDLVLGQPLFTECNPNAGTATNFTFTTPATWYAAGQNPVTATGLFLYPRDGQGQVDQLGGGLRISGKTLLVSDTYNNRALEFRGQ